MLLIRERGKVRVEYGRNFITKSERQLRIRVSPTEREVGKERKRERVSE
jgi:hypothetical protein